MESTEKPLTRKQLTIMFVIKMLNEMAQEGVADVVGEKPLELTPNGFELLGEFEPTQEEVLEVIAEFRSEGYIKDPTIH